VFTPNAGVLYFVAVRAISAAGTGAYSSEVRVSIPSLSQPANRTSTVNQPISPLNLSASDPDGGTLRFSHTGLPFGLTLNTSTGVITGTPTNTGTFNVTVFVADDVVTTSRSFVWTVTGSSDTTQPSLTISSHTSGQTVTTSSITLAGTASDSGAGGSGIASVTVNGQSASGGTASGSNTASWSRSVTLAAGANVLTVVATDGAGNARSAQITVTSSIPDTAAPALSITSHTSGQVVNASSIILAGTATDNNAGGRGITSVTVNGVTASGGTATGNATASWNRSVPLAAGANVLTVIATDGAGNARTSTITIDQDSLAPTLSITSHAGGQTVNTASVTLAGTATDNGRGSHGVSVLVNGSSTTSGTATGSNAASWSRNLTLAVGANTITVEARDTANNITAQQFTLNYALSPVSGVTLISDVASPQLVGSSVRFTAAGSGGIAPRQYKFLLQQGSGTQVLQNWSTSSTYTWTPSAAGSYTVVVWSRSAGVTADVAQASAQASYSIVSPNVSAVSVTPSSGSGATQTFALQYADSRGASGLATEWVWFTGGTGACLAYHERATNAVYLLNDEGTNWMSRSLGSGTLQNSSCSINLAGSSVSTSGSMLTLNLAVSFSPAFNGAKTVRMFANAAGSLSSGWQDRGAWTVNATQPSSPPPSAPPPSQPPSTPPTVQPGVNAVSMTPSTGSGGSQTFSFQFSDSRGASSLVSEWVWFSGGSGLCMAYHERATDTVHLLNDAGTAWNARGLSSGGTLQNNSCSIDLGNSSVSANGGLLTLNLAMNFTSAFSGAKTVRTFANAIGELSSGWQTRGSWTVPTTAPPPSTPPSTPPVQPGVNAVSASPGTGSGRTQTFVLQYSDSRGATNLVSEWVWFSGGTGLCMVYHERSTNRLYLLNDAGTAWISQSLGSGTLQNNSCAIALGSTSASTNGGILTLNLAMTFKSTFTGTKTIQMFANAAGALSSGWQNRGSWVVP
jgi:hypothetical protein